MHRPLNTFMTILVNEGHSVSHAGQKTSVQGTEGSRRKFHCFAQTGFFVPLKKWIPCICGVKC